MNDVALAIEEVRAELSSASSEFFPATCSLIGPVKTTAGAGHTIADSVLASNIPIKVKHVSGGIQVNEGGVNAIKSHRLTLPVRSETLLINQHYKIKVAAYGTNPEMIFEQPVSQVDSMSPFLVLAATLTQGMRYPGIQ